MVVYSDVIIDYLYIYICPNLEHFCKNAFTNNALYIELVFYFCLFVVRYTQINKKNFRHARSSSIQKNHKHMVSVISHITEIDHFCLFWYI